MGLSHVALSALLACTCVLMLASHPALVNADKANTGRRLLGVNNGQAKSQDEAQDEEPNEKPNFMSGGRKGRLVLEADGVHDELTFDFSSADRDKHRTKSLSVLFTEESADPVEAKPREIVYSEADVTYEIILALEEDPTCTYVEVPIAEPDSRPAEKGKGAHYHDDVLDIPDAPFKIEFVPGSNHTKLKSYVVNGDYLQVVEQSDDFDASELSFPICHTFPATGGVNTTAKEVCVTKEMCTKQEPTSEVDEVQARTQPPRNLKEVEVADKDTPRSKAPEHRRSLQDACHADTALVALYNDGMSYGNNCGVGHNERVCDGAVCLDGGLDSCCLRHDLGINPGKSFMDHPMGNCKADYEFRKSCLPGVRPTTTQVANFVSLADCAFSIMPCANWDRVWIPRTCWWGGWWPYSCGSYKHQWVTYKFIYPGKMDCPNGRCWEGDANHYWVADGYCDKFLNTYEAAFDGGDCCEKTCRNEADNMYSCGRVGYDCKQ